MRTLILAFMFALVAGCASMSPEAKLVKGYKAVSTSARAADTLYTRKVITKEDGQRVLSFGDTAKASLDAGQAKLKECRAKEAAGEVVKCEVSNINLGSGILQQLEDYLQSLEAK